MLIQIGFDIAQVMMENEKNAPNFTKKSHSNNFNMEKENYETNVYNHWLIFSAVESPKPNEYHFGIRQSIDR